VHPDTAHIARALELFPPLRDAPPLGSFADRGLVRLGREQVEVTDSDGLRRLTGEK
jgi:hypothetical protein